MEILFNGIISTKPVMGFSYGNNLRKGFLFGLDHPNMRMLMGSLSRFAKLLLCWSIKVDLNDYQIRLKIDLKGNW